ncbi:uncharacterized protein V6R79_006487 [Siganus canaliculatus]
MDSVSQNLQDEISKLLKPHLVCLLMPVTLKQSSHSCERSANRFLVLSPWRGHLLLNKEPVMVESTFSYLEICSINIHDLTKIVLETDKQTLSFSIFHIEDLEAMVRHLIASLKKIFPDSSPGKLLKIIPPDLQQRLITQTAAIEEQLNNKPGSCGGFSDTYAALCDFNDMPLREEIQWDVDNIYYANNWKQFNLHNFNHLDSRDLALAVAALSFNHWFTKIYCKELKLSVDVQQQLTILLSRSPSLEELSLETSGLKPDFAVKVAAALQAHPSSTLHSISLSGNPIEDKGVIALSKELGNLAEGLKHLSLSRVSMTAKGLGCLSKMLSSTQRISESLVHLNLSGNPGSLMTEEATFLFKFLSSANALCHLDLSDTNCPLDTLFVSLSAGCCSKLMYLNLARNPFSHRKVRDVTKSIQEFFSQSCELRYAGLSATKLPPQALRLLLQGLATNTRLSELELDLSSCELRSAGAQVIQEHISEVTAIRSLDISDNGFENDMVTLVLAVGRCHSLQHLSLGRNFSMKSRALNDTLHRIAQLIQDEDCPLQSLSVCDSKLKAGMHILLSALGGHSSLVELDISGNNIGDTGAKILAKALLKNTRLRSLTWDRNNVTARGFQDVADAMERNFTLQNVSLPLTDVTQSYRSNLHKTKEALCKMQQCLVRNNQTQSNKEELHQVPRIQPSEELVRSMCQQLENRLIHLSHCNTVEVQPDICAAHEVLHNANEAFKLLPSLYDASMNSTSNEDFVNCILTDTTCALGEAFNRRIQEMAEGLMEYAEAACPRVVQQSSVCLSEFVSKRNRQTHAFLRSTLVKNSGQMISYRLRELKQALGVTLAKSIIEQVLQDLTKALDKMNCLLKEHEKDRTEELRGVDSSFPTDDYSAAFWRNSFHSKRQRAGPSLSSLDADWEQHNRDRRKESDGEGCVREEVGGAATPLSFTILSASPSGQEEGEGDEERRWQREGEVAAVETAAAISRAERGASSTPSVLHFICTPTSEEVPIQEAPFLGCNTSSGPVLSTAYPASPMEPLPTRGQTLRHYTASRPRPRRTHTQPPSSRPQELVSVVENKADEGMGRVDEGVEEFFTKKIIPDYALKGQWEESNPGQALSLRAKVLPLSLKSHSIFLCSPVTTTVTPPSVTSTDAFFMSTDVQPLSTCYSDPAPPLPSYHLPKTSRKVLCLQKSSSQPSPQGRRRGRRRWTEGQRDIEREGGRRAKSFEEANVSDVAASTEGAVTTSHHLAGNVQGMMAPAKTLTMMVIVTSSSHDPSIAMPSNLGKAAVPVFLDDTSSLATLPLVAQKSSDVLLKETKLGSTPNGEKRLTCPRGHCAYLTSMHGTVLYVSDKMDYIENYSRRDNIIIDDLDEYPNEKCTETEEKNWSLLSEKMTIDHRQIEIEHAHYSGKPVSVCNKPQPITTRELKKTTQKLERKWRSSKLEEHRTAWLDGLSSYRRMLRRARASYYSTLIEENKNNHRFLFSTVARLTKSHSVNEPSIPVTLGNTEVQIQSSRAHSDGMNLYLESSKGRPSLRPSAKEFVPQHQKHHYNHLPIGGSKATLSTETQPKIPSQFHNPPRGGSKDAMTTGTQLSAATVQFQHSAAGVSKAAMSTGARPKNLKNQFHYSSVGGSKLTPSMEEATKETALQIAQMETGGQDAALAALQNYNKEMNHCFTFPKEEEQAREHLGVLVLGFLNKELQPSCQLACLETVRILSRDQKCLAPFISHSAMATFAHFAGIAVGADIHVDSKPVETTDEGRDGGQDAEVSSEAVNEANLPSENPDQEVIIESLKCICNILLHNETAQVIAEDLQLIKGVAERLKQCHDPSWNHKVRFFDLRLTFLLTALRVKIRGQLTHKLHGISLLGNQLDSTLGLSWPDTLETARVGFEAVPHQDLPPLDRQQTELAMEILKILFNITSDTNKHKVDEEEAAEYRHLGAILRHCLMSKADEEELTEDFHSHTVNLLGNLPLPCLDVLLIPKVQQDSTEYMGVNMDAVNMLLELMEKRLDRGHKLKETILLPLNLLTKSARIHRETRKFLRSKVLPPLRDVTNRPEVGSTLRNKLVRLMTHTDTDVKDYAAEFLFVLCKESVSRFIKYTGYGNAAGLLAARGLLTGGSDSGIYSEDEDSDTEEYREAKAHINPVTGVVEEEQPNPMEGMTEEQKEYEAMKLINMFDKLSRGSVIQPMQLGLDGKMREMTSEDMCNLTHNCFIQPEEQGDSDSEEEA